MSNRKITVKSIKGTTVSQQAGEKNIQLVESIISTSQSKIISQGQYFHIKEKNT